MQVLTFQTESDRLKLHRQLINLKRDFRMQLFMYVGLWLIAPFLNNRLDHKPMIENMGYGKALLFFGMFFIVPIAWSYFKNLHNAVVGSQTQLKRLIITDVTGIVAKPLFRKETFRLKLADSYLRKLYLPKKDLDRYKAGDRLRIEISEHGKQLIRITPATERIINTISRKNDESPSVDKLPYTQVLFGGVSNDKSALQLITFIFIPREGRVISTLIIYINILVFILMLISGVSIYKPQGIDIVHWGGNYGPLTIDAGEYWRMLTCIFVHIGIIHLVMNLIGFVFVAYFLESVLGWKWMLFTYIFTGLMASGASLWWHSDIVGAGASGAIFGMYGLLLILLLTTDKKDRGIFSGMITVVLIFIGYNLLMGITGNTDNAAHIGGLLAGIVLGGVLIWTGLLKKLKAGRANTQNMPIL